MRPTKVLRDSWLNQFVRALEPGRKCPQSADVKWIAKISPAGSSLVLAVMFLAAIGGRPAWASASRGPFFLPTGDAAKFVTVTREGAAEAGVTVVTEAVAIKETAPKSIIDKFGEVYAFSPAFIAVHRDQPTQIEFWNLQGDDEHDFALVGPDLKILMYEPLPPLQKTSYIFTFHREGVVDFKCLRHQPAMSGQILVLPPARR
jgi:plastocyanin